MLEVKEKFVSLSVKFSTLKGMSRHAQDCNLKGNRLINILLRSNLGQLAGMRIQKRVFQTKVASSLHWSSEVWGIAKAAKLEVVKLAGMRIQKRVFQTKVASSLHWSSEVWGIAKAAKLEVVQLRYFKRILGLKDSFTSVVMKVDLGLFTLKSVRLVKIVKFWGK